MTADHKLGGDLAVSLWLCLQFVQLSVLITENPETHSAVSISLLNGSTKSYIELVVLICCTFKTPRQMILRGTGRRHYRHKRRQSRFRQRGRIGPAKRMQLVAQWSSVPKLLGLHSKQ